MGLVFCTSRWTLHHAKVLFVVHSSYRKANQAEDGGKQIQENKSREKVKNLGMSNLWWSSNDHLCELSAVWLISSFTACLCFCLLSNSLPYVKNLTMREARIISCLGIAWQSSLSTLGGSLYPFIIVVPWPVNLNSDFPAGEIAWRFLPSGKWVFSYKKVWISSAKELIMFRECFIACNYAQTNTRLIVEMFSPASPYSTEPKIKQCA